MRARVRASVASVVAVASVIASVIACIGVSGCKATALAPNQNDALRAQVRDLSEKVTSLEAQRTELEQQLAKCVADSTLQPSTDPEVAAATPQVSRVQIDPASRLLRLTERQEDSVPKDRSLVRVYIDVSDGLGRAMQFVGKVRLSLFELDAGGESGTIATAQYTPVQVREAWRGGLMGPHYTFDVPIKDSDWVRAESATVRFEFTDGITGKVFNAQQELAPQK